MPVILDEACFDAWLDLESEAELLEELLKPYADDLAANPVLSASGGPA